MQGHLNVVSKLPRLSGLVKQAEGAGSQDLLEDTGVGAVGHEENGHVAPFTDLVSCSHAASLIAGVAGCRQKHQVRAQLTRQLRGGGGAAGTACHFIAEGQEDLHKAVGRGAGSLRNQYARLGHAHGSLGWRPNACGATASLCTTHHTPCPGAAAGRQIGNGWSGKAWHERRRPPHFLCEVASSDYTTFGGE
jgi:hypothetical protein